MNETFFEGVKIEQVVLSTGARIGLPVRYYDWSVIMAHFPTPTAAVRKLLPTNKLKPAQLMQERPYFLWWRWSIAKSLM